MRRLLSRLLLVLAVLALVLGLGELAARRLAPREAPIRFAQNVKMLESQGRAQSASVLAYDEELFWRLKPDLVLPATDWPLRGRISNAQGFREEHEIPRVKPKGELRILFLGDSCTFGTGLLPEEGFVQRSEALLRAAHPERGIECINAGVPGYTSFQGWRRLESQGFDYQPDLVVVTFGWNDISHWDDSGDLEQYERWRREEPPPALRWSRLAALCARRLAAAATPGAAAGAQDAPSKGRLRISPAEHRQMIERIAAACDARGVALLIVVWPIPQNYVQDPNGPPANRFELQRIDRELGGARTLSPSLEKAVLDLVPIAGELLQSRPLGEVYQDHVHGTALANDAFARALAAKLDAWSAAR